MSCTHCDIALLAENIAELTLDEAIGDVLSAFGYIVGNAADNGAEIGAALELIQRAAIQEFTDKQAQAASFH